jgi:hypothetical protein
LIGFARIDFSGFLEARPIEPHLSCIDRRRSVDLCWRYSTNALGALHDEVSSCSFVSATPAPQRMDSEQFVIERRIAHVASINGGSPLPALDQRSSNSPRDLRPAIPDMD